MTWTAVSMCQPQPGPENIQLTCGAKPPNDASITGLRRHRRMQIDRDVERLGAFQDRPVEFVVEVAAAIMAVDDRALEARWRTRRSSSSAAFSGAAVGSAAKPANRVGCFFTASARKSLASRATAIASAASNCSVPGYCSDSTCISMPAASISAKRLSPTSASRPKKSASRPPDFSARSLNSRPGPAKNPGLAKCSSSVMVRISVLSCMLRLTGTALRAFAHPPMLSAVEYVVAEILHFQMAARGGRPAAC